MNLTGSVRGGQQPVTGATIQLYAVGTSGDGSAATPQLTPAALTDSNGNFNITGTYTCPAGNPLVYIVATGGNPGVASSNPNLALMAALGPCGNLTSSTYIVINELTTVGAVYPLAAFMTSAAAVGSGTSDAAALASAFTLASELVNTATGTAPGTNVPSGATVPVAQINTLGDILASCINSTGGTAGDGSACGSLFTLTSTGTPPTSTIAALLNLANNPTMNTTGLYALATATGPFQPMQAVAPPTLGAQLNSPSTVYVTPTSLSFGAWTSGDTSLAQTITVTNFTSTPVTLSAVIAGPGASSFGMNGGTCGAMLAPQTACTYQIDFTPTSTGAFSAALVLSNNSPNPLIEVALSGTGATTIGPVTMSASTLNFNVADTAQDVQVENYGNTPLTISNVAISNFTSNSMYYSANSSDFSETNNCGTTLSAQSVCTITAVSTGQAWSTDVGAVTYTATMTIYDNASTGPQTVSLTSTNIGYFEIQPPLNFGYDQPGSPITDSIVLTSGSNYNTIGVSLGLGGADAGDFTLGSLSSCSAINQSPCTFAVTFDPSTAGTRSAKLLVSVPYQTSIEGQYIPLIGTGIGTGPLFTVTPSAISSLGNMLPSSPDPSSNANTSAGLTITNYGTTSFSFAGSFSGANASLFTVNGSACASLAPQNSCSVTVSFSGASGAGVYQASLLVKDANSTLSQAVPITATTTYWGVAVSPRSLTFGDQALGTSSAAASLVLADPNGYPIGHPLSVALQSPSNFTLTQGSTCPASLTQTCMLAVAFSPYEVGSISEVATITDLTSGETSSLQLRGNGGAPAVSLSPGALAFPLRSSGTTSVPMTETVTNSGTQPLSISSVNVVGAVNNNFTETNNCGTVAVNAACSINVTFAPTATGAQSATIQIVSNAASSPDSFGVSGTAD